MNSYYEKALTRSRHKHQKIMDQPHKHAILVYGIKVQHAKEANTSAKLNTANKLFIQQVTGIFLYYAQAVDATMLVALSAIASDQSAPTKETMTKTLQFLDYVATHPDAILMFSASSMVLNVHSNKLYLTKQK